MSDPYNNREIVNDFIRYKLTQRGYGQSGPSPPPPPPSSPPPPPSSQSTAQLLRVLRAAGDEFESRYRASFSDLSQQLHVSQGCAEQRFAEVTAELFRDGVNWGRVVAFLAFGAALCAECADKEMGFLVDGIAQWMANYLDEELRDWIQQNGGWGGLPNWSSKPRKRQRWATWHPPPRPLLLPPRVLGAFLTEAPESPTRVNVPSDGR
ncbi:bcl-2-like protein 2 isoform X3 [Lampetra planeri]